MPIKQTNGSRKKGKRFNNTNAIKHKKSGIHTGRKNKKIGKGRR